VFSHPLKKAIRKQIDMGRTPRQAVHAVFSSKKIKDQFTKMLMDNVEKSLDESK
jgi:hypothetical protein